MLPLPIDRYLPEILQSLSRHSGLVLVAEPGAGKTTRVPPALAQSGILPGDAPHIIMLQPRRIAARAAAQRIADERHWELGADVGYHIRFEKRCTHRTRIRIFTEAILTRMLLEDPYLAGIGAVILDEFHERNLHTDLALAFLRELQQTVRPDLKLIIMSATLDAQPAAAFLGDAPVLASEGRTFPVETLYRPSREPLMRSLEQHLPGVVEEALQREGDILIFLPGVREIERARQALGARLRADALLVPLHGSLSAEEQFRAVRPAQGSRRKIVLATNIAETSLTIDGVRTVIDSGLVRVASFDPDRGMDRLDLDRISQASAAQRAGRAGRQAPGCVLRLWPEQDQKHLTPFNLPDVERVDLAGAVLAVHAWGARDIRQFGWFEKPPEERLRAAEELLELLGALHEGSLTDAGKLMLSVPAHPRIARMLLAAAGSSLEDEAVRLAAVLADDSRTREAANPLALIDRLSPAGQKIREQLERVVRELRPSRRQSATTPASLPELLLLAYPDRVARRRGADPHAALMVGGIGLRLAPGALTPAIAAAPLFLALDARHDARNRQAEAIVSSAIPLDIELLERLFDRRLRRETALEYDPKKERVVASTRRCFRDLLLEDDPHGRVDPEKAGPVLAAALAGRAGELFTRNEAAARLLARTALLRHFLPNPPGVGGTPWPAFDDAQLRALLSEAAAGKKSLAELAESHALPHALRAALVYPLDRLLDQHAPEAIEVPSGSHIKLDYALPAGSAPPPPPVLAVRLQELFGLLETPRVAGGRVPVLLHLLSPGFKPIQITSDLRSFWSSAYFEVRKDLRTRYPKHKWPEDPLTAQPEARGKRRHP